MSLIDGRSSASARVGRWALAAPFVVGLVAVLVLAFAEPRRLTDARQLYTIPAGTAARVVAGESVSEVMPQRLATRAGVTLVVQNDDDQSHVFGPFVLSPGQSWSRQFAVAGDYAMTCSLYPTADLEIVVAPPPEPPQRVLAAHRALALAWLILCTLMVAGSVVAMAKAGEAGAETCASARAADVATRDGSVATGHAVAPTHDVDDSTRAGAEPTNAGSALARDEAEPKRAGTVHLLARLAPGVAFTLIALDLLALSRVAPWRVAIASRSLSVWLALAAMAAALPVLESLARADARLRPYLRLAAVGVAATAAGLGVATWLGTTSVGVAAATWGLGMMAAASWLAARPEAPKADERHGARAGTADGPVAHGRPLPPDALAVTGACLVLAALPWPDATPPLVALRAVVIGALAAVAWRVGARRIADDGSGTVWLARGASVALLVAALALVGWAWLAHTGAALGL